jgi:hypothetical protein
MRFAFLAIFFASAAFAVAEPVIFVSGGLKEELVVELDVTGKLASGNFRKSEYERERAVPMNFTGKVVPTPKGKTGVFLKITFDPKKLQGEKAPYNAPPKVDSLVWQLRIVQGRAHLFIPMQMRSYEGKTRWIVADCELKPEDASKKP